MKIRLLETGWNTAAFNMALDEVLMKAAPQGEPILKLYAWKPPAVSLGYFQSVSEEVDEEKCKAHGVDIVRRSTGGGAVFHDSEITYSFITREYPENIIESYKWVCSGIIEGLKTIGIDATFVPLNDLVWQGKKFSGNAQTRKGKVMLQHGTILLKVDVDKMFEILKVPDEKLKGKMIETVKQRVIGLDKGFEEVAQALKIGFAKAMGAELVKGELAAHEKQAAEELAKTKYSTREWVYRIP